MLVCHGAEDPVWKFYKYPLRYLNKKGEDKTIWKGFIAAYNTMLANVVSWLSEIYYIST